MVGERDLLLRTILENPADDAPRLVFADWLEETGEPANMAWAQFIRVQCDLHRRETESGDTGLWIDGNTECHRLLNAWGKQWLHPVWASPLWENTVWRRGFPAMIACPWEAWSDHEALIVRTTPLEEVKLTTWPRLEGQHDGGALTCCLAGRDHWESFPEGTPQEDVIRRLLIAEWPSIRFGAQRPFPYPAILGRQPITDQGTA